MDLGLGGRTGGSGEEGVKATPAAGAPSLARLPGMHRSILLILLAPVALATAHPNGGIGSGVLQETVQSQLSRIVFTLVELILSWEGTGGWWVWGRGRAGSCHPSEIPGWAQLHPALCFFRGEITAGTWLLNPGALWSD